MSGVFKRGSAEIEANLTPMIDVTFLLIVFFVLVSQIVEVESVQMKLPEPIDPATELAGEEQRVVINVLPEAGGKIAGYRLGTRSFPPDAAGLQALKGQLRTLFASNPQAAVNLRADRETNYEFVEPVMEIVAAAASGLSERPNAARVNLVVVRER